MRIAVISDIHSNLEALTRVLATIDRFSVDRIYCLGDIVGYGPYPNECIDLVRKRCHVVVKGNHDSGVVGETPLEDFNSYGRSAIIWTRKKITKERSTYLELLPFHAIEEDVTLVHASPASPAEWTYVFSWPAAEEAFQAFNTSLCFIGHTHSPVIIADDGTIGALQRGKRYLINAGSTGQPRDGIPSACFALFDSESWTCTIERVTYDVKKTDRAIRARRLPPYLGIRLYTGT